MPICRKCCRSAEFCYGIGTKINTGIARVHSGHKEIKPHNMWCGVWINGPWNVYVNCLYTLGDILSPEFKKKITKNMLPFEHSRLFETGTYRKIRIVCRFVLIIVPTWSLKFPCKPQSIIRNHVGMRDMSANRAGIRAQPVIPCYPFLTAFSGNSAPTQL